MRGSSFLIPLLGLSFVIFQNCGAYRASDRFDVYQYKVAPNFYHDVKVVSVEKDDAHRYRYIFDVAVAYTHDPDGEVNYQLDFSTIAIPGVCNSAQGTATGGEKHFRVECLIPVEDDLYVQMTLQGPSGEEVQQQYRF